MNSFIIQEYVFGYGSLICPHSRAITAPTLAQKTVTPVVVKNVERTWAKKAMGGESSWTAMGVRFKDDAECVGVLLPVNQQELKQFDRRERGYDRVPLYLGDVEPVPFLDDSHYDAKGHSTFLDAKDQKHRIKIWMYMQQELTPPSEAAPIPQSYVDTILRGCLTISEDFAEQFIANTKGWTPNEIVNDDDDNDDCDSDESMDDNDNQSVDSSNLSEEDVYWVNDRHNPIYSRGDQQYMLQNGHKLDKLLKRHREEFQYRTFRHVPAANE